MFSASNLPAEAATASPPEPKPITPEAPLPVRRIAMSQTWRRLTFLHWAYEPSVVRRLLPPDLALDLFDNAAWVGLIPFEIHNLRGIPHFPETNVRTYVVGPDGSRAVWFFSLDADRLVAVLGARARYRLPYMRAKMSVTMEGSVVRYESLRQWPHSAASSRIAVRPAERYRPEELGARDHFVTARYRLYARKRGGLAYAQIEHASWPLARATLLDLDQNLIQAAGLPPPEGAALVHYCADLDVKIGFLQKPGTVHSITDFL